MREKWLNDSPDYATVVLKIIAADRQGAIEGISRTPKPFDHWRQQQVLALHGVILSKLCQLANHSMVAFM